MRGSKILKVLGSRKGKRRTVSDQSWKNPQIGHNPGETGAGQSSKQMVNGLKEYRSNQIGGKRGHDRLWFKNRKKSRQNGLGKKASGKICPVGHCETGGGKKRTRDNLSKTKKEVDRIICGKTGILDEGKGLG